MLNLASLTNPAHADLVTILIGRTLWGLLHWPDKDMDITQQADTVLASRPSLDQYAECSTEGTLEIELIWINDIYSRDMWPLRHTPPNMGVTEQHDVPPAVLDVSIVRHSQPDLSNPELPQPSCAPTPYLKAPIEDEL